MIADLPAEATDNFAVPQVASQTTPTWNDLVAIEPRLETLAVDAFSSRWSAKRYETIKRRVSNLVGWHARNPKLGSSRCYEVALWHLAGLLRARRRSRR